MIRKSAQIAALMFIFSIPWENAFTLGSLGSVSRLVGLLAAGLWVVSVLVEKRIRAFNAYYGFIFAFFLFNLASIFWTVNFNLTFQRIFTYAQMAFQVWMLWDLLSTHKLYRYALAAFIFGSYISIFSTIANFLSGQIISEWEYGRYTGAGQNAVEMAASLSLCFPVAWHLATTQEPGPRANLFKTAFLAFIPGAFFAIILTASRTALFSVIPGIIYIVASLGQFKPALRFAAFFGLTLAIVVGQAFIPQATLERLSTIGSSISSGDLGGRVSLWKQALEIFLDHPLLGVGAGALPAPNQLGAVAHNTFLSILTELGVTGFFIFIGMMANAFIRALKQPRASAYLWVTVLITWIVAVQSLTWEYTKPTWFFLSMVGISAGVWSQRDRFTE